MSRALGGSVEGEREGGGEEGSGEGRRKWLAMAGHVNFPGGVVTPSPPPLHTSPCVSRFALGYRHACSIQAEFAP